jgi:hypothetical protein
MTDVTFEEYLLKKYDINQIEEKENKQRVLRNSSFRVSSKGFKEFFLTALLLRKKDSESYINDIKRSTVEIDYLSHYNYLKKNTTDKKTLFEYLLRQGISPLDDEYNALIHWKKEINNTNIFLRELQNLTKDSIVLEIKESLILSDVMVTLLKRYYQTLLNDFINNKQLITSIKDDIKKFDMVIKYDKRLINCKIITI